MSDKQQTRKHPRIQTDATVDFTGNDVLLYHRIENISLGGICIQAASVEEVGTIVELAINFPELGAAIEVKGEVVWANHEVPKDMGIRFFEMDEASKATLSKYLVMKSEASGT